MNLQEAQIQLADTTFLLGRFRQNGALKYLAGTEEVAAMDVLVSTLDQGHLSKKITALLNAENRQQQMDRLWSLWASGRSPQLAAILRQKNTPAIDPKLSTLSLLKLNLAAKVATDPVNIRQTLLLLNDQDADIQGALGVYLARLTLTDTNAEDIHKAWVTTNSPHLENIFIRQDPQALNPLWRLWAETRSPRLETILQQKNTPATDPKLNTLSLLKLNLAAKVATDPVNIRQALLLLNDQDADIQNALGVYLARLTLTDANAEDIHKAWVTTNSPHLENIFIRQDPQALNPLWRLWAETRSPRLEAILQQKNTPATDPKLSTLSLLKLNLAAKVATDPINIRQALLLLNDQDADIQSALGVYLARLTLTDANAEDIHKAWVTTNSPHLENIFIRQDSQSLDILWRLWTSKRIQRLGSILRQKNIPANDTGLNLLSLLKLSRSAEVPTDLVNLRRVLALLADSDTDVQAALIAYFERLSVTEENVDELNSAWMRSKSGYLGAIFFRQDPQDVEPIWHLWAKERTPQLSAILREKNTPAQAPDLHALSRFKLNQPVEIASDRATVRNAFNLLADSDPDIRQGVLAYVQQLPMTDDIADDIYTTWLRTDSKELFFQLHNRHRKPTNPAMEALFLILDGQIEAYLALENENGDYFQEAYILASEDMRQRVNKVVQHSGNNRLFDFYKKTLAGTGALDTDMYIQSLKTVNNETGLLDASQYLTLPGLLDLCQRWSKNGWRPQESKAATLVEQALTGYAKVGDLRVEARASSPTGTVDLFDYWRAQQLTDDDLCTGLDQEDPFIRARSLYLGNLRGTLPSGRLEQAARSDHWPERLVALLFRPELAQGADHVHWVNVCSGGASQPVLSEGSDLLTMPVACNPEQYSEITRLLKQCQVGQMKQLVLNQNQVGQEENNQRYQGLLTILHAFQTYHGGGTLLEFADDDSCDEKGTGVFTDFAEAPL